MWCKYSFWMNQCLWSMVFSYSVLRGYHFLCPGSGCVGPCLVSDHMVITLTLCALFTGQHGRMVTGGLGLTICRSRGTHGPSWGGGWHGSWCASGGGGGMDMEKNFVYPERQKRQFIIIIKRKNILPCSWGERDTGDGEMPAQYQREPGYRDVSAPLISGGWLLL